MPKTFAWGSLMLTVLLVAAVVAIILWSLRKS
jgi:hypothetical protein